MRKVIRSVEMFLEYLQGNPTERDSYRLFQSFAQQLYTGTFDSGTGLDPSGLCWFPRGAQDARNIVSQLTGFFDWLSEIRPAAANVNPRYAGGLYDRMTDEAAYQYRRDTAPHTSSSNARLWRGRYLQIPGRQLGIEREYFGRTIFNFHPIQRLLSIPVARK